MAASNIVIADAQATPVNHIFIPIGYDENGVFWFEDQSQSSSVGFWRISIEAKRPKANATVADSVYRTRIGLHEPVLQTLGTNDAGLTPPPTVAYTPRCFAEYIDPQRSLLIDRQNMAKMAPLLLQNTQITDILTKHTMLTL